MKIKFLFIFLFAVLIPGLCGAFVPETPHLLYMVMEKIKRPVGIEVYQTKKIINYNSIETESVELDEKLSYAFPNQFRSQMLSPDFSGFTVESNFEFIKVMDGKTVSRKKSNIDRYADVLLYRDYRELMYMLDRDGVDTTDVSFQRYKDTICYVIGRPPEIGKNHAGLWIEKDTFFPLKYVIHNNDLIVAFYYDEWQQVSKTWYPMRIRIFMDDQMFAVIQAKQVNLKKIELNTRFDIRYLAKLYPENITQPSDEEKDPVDELDQQIENFKKLYE